MGVMLRSFLSLSDQDRITVAQVPMSSSPAIISLQCLHLLERDMPVCQSWTDRNGPPNFLDAWCGARCPVLPISHQ